MFFAKFSSGLWLWFFCDYWSADLQENLDIKRVRHQQPVVQLESSACNPIHNGAPADLRVQEDHCCCLKKQWCLSRRSVPPASRADPAGAAAAMHVHTCDCTYIVFVTRIDEFRGDFWRLKSF